MQRSDPGPGGSGGSAGSGGSILAIDLGTSSARALVLDGTATPIPGALARHKVETAYGAEGEATLDLDGYVDGLLACIDELHAGGHLEDIQHIVMSSQWHSIVALDNFGKPLTPVIPWVDTRSIPPTLPTSFDEHAFHARTGAWLHRLYWSRRIPWLRSVLGSSASAFAGLPDLVLERLTGERLTSVSVASGTGILELATGQYDAEALAIAGVSPSQLPPIVPSRWTGRLSPSYALRWPSLVAVPVHPPTGDGAASNVGTGGYDVSTAAVTIGTSAAVRVVHPIADAPELPWELWRYRVDDERAVTGMAFSAAGNMHAWLTGVLDLESSEPDGVEVGSSRVIAIPFQAGTRPPETVPGGSGVYFGLSFDDTAADLLAASLQGASLEIDRGLRMLDALFGRELEVVLGGGGIHASSWWRRCLTATFGREADVCSEAEVGARGAAAVALGLSPSPGGEHLTPDAADAARVASLRPRYTALRSLAVTAATL